MGSLCIYIYDHRCRSNKKIEESLNSSVQVPLSVAHFALLIHDIVIFIAHLCFTIQRNATVSDHSSRMQYIVKLHA